MTGRTGGRCAGLKPGEGTCPDCGKIKYGSRKKAKAAARRMCGIAWNKANEIRGLASALIEADEGE